MKFSGFIFFGLLLAGYANAATWIVDSNTSRPANFRTLQAANDSASVADGDTLYLMPSTSGYGDLWLSKRLTLIGPGYLLNQNLPFSVAAPSARTGKIVFYLGSTGSLVTGCEVVGNIDMVADLSVFPYRFSNNFTVKRNFIHGSVSNYAGSPSSNIQILQNHIVGSLNLGNDNSSGVLVRGNYVGADIEIARDSHSGIVSHNLVGRTLKAGGTCVFENNLVKDNIHCYGNALIRNCWGLTIGTSGGTPTITNCVEWTSELTFDAQFVGTGSLDARWQLAADAPIKAMGYGGVNPGHLAGPDPYVISGLPAVPMVKGILAPSSASAASGLPITVELQVNP